MNAIYLDKTGPMIRYSNGVLHVEDLNPEVKTKWHMSRGEMLRTGWRFIWAAFTSPSTRTK